MRDVTIARRLTSQLVPDKYTSSMFKECNINVKVKAEEEGCACFLSKSSFFRFFLSISFKVEAEEVQAVRAFFPATSTHARIAWDSVMVCRSEDADRSSSLLKGVCLFVHTCFDLIFHDSSFDLSHLLGCPSVLET